MNDTYSLQFLTSASETSTCKSVNENLYYSKRDGIISSLLILILIKLELASVDCAQSCQTVFVQLNFASAVVQHNFAFWRVMRQGSTWSLKDEVRGLEACRQDVTLIKTRLFRNLSRQIIMRDLQQDPAAAAISWRCESDKFGDTEESMNAIKCL